MEKTKFYLNKTDGGYVYDKRIFWGIIGITLLLIFFIAYQQDFDFKYKFYFECDEDVCKNPAVTGRGYNPITGQEIECEADWCSKEYLPRGEYGTKPLGVLKLFPFLVVGLLIASLILNHLIHNRGKDFEIQLNLSDNWKKKFKKLSEETEDDDKNNSKD